MKILLITSLITTAVISGAIFSWLTIEDDTKRDGPSEIEADNRPLQLEEGQPLSIEPSASESVSTSPAEEDPDLVDLDVDHVERGDQSLIVGNFDGAYREYLKATNDYLADLPPTLLLRLAITTEQMGNLKKSDEYYQKAVRRSSSESTIRILGLTGVARAWQNNGQLRQAQELLSELFLRYASIEALHEEVRYQISYQLGSVSQQSYLTNIAEPLDAMESLEFLWLGPSIDAMLEILLDEGDTDLEALANYSGAAEFTILQRPTANANLIAVDTKSQLMPIENILGQYAEQAKLSFETSKRARDIIESRSARLSVSGLPLAVVLDHLLSPLGLVWVQDAETIYLYEQSERGIDLQRYRLELADRCLRMIELNFSRDVRRDSSLLHRGNLQLLNGDLDAAATRYSELEKLIPGNELAAKLSFNAAHIDIAKGRSDIAVKRMFFTVDQSLEQHLQARGYAWIGRLELQHGRSDRAVYALSRGLSLAKGVAVRQDVLMNLAKAYLLENDPFSANRILFNETDSVIDLPEQKKAAVFAAYARYLGMVPGEGLRNEGERMVVALASITPEDAPGFVDRLLIGRAFFEVGFDSRSTEFLELALKIAPHENWRRRVAFELATNLYRSGELTESEKLLQTLIGDQPDQTSLLSQLMLARIALSQKRSELCLEICQQIWSQDIGDDQKIETLSMMGRAYQQLGRHQVAALCFSGMVPHEINKATATDPSKSEPQNIGTLQTKP